MNATAPNLPSAITPGRSSKITPALKQRSTAKISAGVVIFILIIYIYAIISEVQFLGSAGTDLFQDSVFQPPPSLALIAGTSPSTKNPYKATTTTPTTSSPTTQPTALRLCSPLDELCVQVSYHVLSMPINDLSIDSILVSGLSIDR